jgi:N-acetyl-anhydromuramyl-L-alanine amidase AmpD
MEKTILGPPGDIEGGCGKARFSGILLAVACACAGRPTPVPDDWTPRPGSAAPRSGDEIVACGRFFHTGARVVLWMDPGGYDAYRPHRRFEPDVVPPSEGGEGAARYGTFRRNLPKEIAARVRERGWDLEDLQQVVRQVVLHYDAAGSSRNCFRVLHDVRGLSCHFLLDLDGTIYQTLDLKERAWHAQEANDASIGIEIANWGAYPSEEELRRVAGPEGEPRKGVVQGREFWQYPFTEPQYDALAKLLEALLRVFPGIPARVPPESAVFAGALGYRGILGHFHLTPGKLDPGPAFDWARLRRSLGGNE